MTFAYQPSAAGISWLTLCQTLDSRALMEKELMKLSGTNSQVQISMTKSTADSTLEELTHQADGQAANARFTIGAACAGIATSAATTIGSIATMPKNVPEDQKYSLGVAKTSTPTSISEELNNLNTHKVAVEVDAQNSNNSAPKATNTTQDTKDAAPKQTSGPVRSGLNKLFTEHGNSLSQAMNSGIAAGGQIMQSNATLAQAKAKQIEALAQGLSSVMNAQGQMLSSAISGCDNSMNNTESTITTIIQVSAVRG